MQHELDLAAIVRHDLDLDDQLAHRLDQRPLLGGAGRVLGDLREHGLQPGDLGGEQLVRVRVQLGRGLGVAAQAGEVGLDLGLFRLEGGETPAHGRRRRSVADGVEHPLDLAAELGGAALERPAALGLGLELGLIGGVIGADIERHRRRREHALAHPVEHPALDLLAVHHAAIRADARALLAVGGADEAGLAVARVGRATPALEQAGEHTLAGGGDLPRPLAAGLGEAILQPGP